MLSGALAVALALSVLLATSHRMINLDEQGIPYPLRALRQDMDVESGSHHHATFHTPLSHRHHTLGITELVKYAICDLQTDQE